MMSVAETHESSGQAAGHRNSCEFCYKLDSISLPHDSRLQRELLLDIREAQTKTRQLIADG